jgi:hypothetical protein
MYLVMLECSWDDVPLHLFTTRKDAEQYAKTLSVNEAHQRLGQLLERDLTEPLVVSIVRFNAAGYPKRHTIERHLEDEDTE